MKSRAFAGIVGMSMSLFAYAGEYSQMQKEIYQELASIAQEVRSLSVRKEAMLCHNYIKMIADGILNCRSDLQSIKRGFKFASDMLVKLGELEIEQQGIFGAVATGLVYARLGMRLENVAERVEKAWPLCPGQRMIDEQEPMGDEA